MSNCLTSNGMDIFNVALDKMTQSNLYRYPTLCKSTMEG